MRSFSITLSAGVGITPYEFIFGLSGPPFDANQVGGALKRNYPDWPVQAVGCAITFNCTQGVPRIRVGYHTEGSGGPTPSPGDPRGPEIADVTLGDLSTTGRQALVIHPSLASQPGADTTIQAALPSVFFLSIVRTTGSSILGDVLVTPIS